MTSRAKNLTALALMLAAFASGYWTRKLSTPAFEIHVTVAAKHAGVLT